MKIPTPPFLALLVLVAGCVAPDRRSGEGGPEVSSGSEHSSWLTGSAAERFATIERQLRGLDQAMAEIGYRYGELVVAAHERNWDYAVYQTEKIDLALRLALERRPARAASAMPFLEKSLPAVAAAIGSRDGATLDGALAALEAGCVQCHRAEDVLFFKPAVERIRQRALGEAGPR